MIGALFLEKQVPDCRYTHRKKNVFLDIKYDFKSNYSQLCGFMSRIFEYLNISCYFGLL